MGCPYLSSGRCSDGNYPLDMGLCESSFDTCDMYWLIQGTGNQDSGHSRDGYLGGLDSILADLDPDSPAFEEISSLSLRSPNIKKILKKYNLR